MNTKPDDVMLALWLDDELEGDELARVEAWAATRPDQLAAREETRRWRSTAAATLPREIEPPYADFFNTRILSAIADNRTRAESAAPAAKVRWWRAGWFMPTTAAAGMALAFWLGGRTAGPGMRTMTVNNDAAPVVYTPDNDVEARYFAGKNGSSTVIVLDGVSAIPDTLDFQDTAWNASPGDLESTASTEIETPGKVVR